MKIDSNDEDNHDKMWKKATLGIKCKFIMTGKIISLGLRVFMSINPKLFVAHYFPAVYVCVLRNIK